jgi:pantoate--beta-alanine ligase
MAQGHGERVAVVPTMGALHEGHLSLVVRAKETCQRVVATVFVNPTQFAPGEDFDKYPRDLERDFHLLAQRQCDVVFAPERDEVYPPGSETMIDVGSAARPLEGVVRPTHFAGVATVVMKLWHLVPADVMVLGEKDYQQTIVLKRLMADLCVPVEIVVAPIVREADGLAMSSRNAYLSPSERTRATALCLSLQVARDAVARGERDSRSLKQKMIEELERHGIASIDYVALVREGTLDEVKEIVGPTRALVAVRVGTTRLIDNMLVTAE